MVQRRGLGNSREREEGQRPWVGWGELGVSTAGTAQGKGRQSGRRGEVWRAGRSSPSPAVTRVRNEGFILSGEKSFTGGSGAGERHVIPFIFWEETLAAVQKGAADWGRRQAGS